MVAQHAVNLKIGTSSTTRPTRVNSSRASKQNRNDFSKTNNQTDGLIISADEDDLPRSGLDERLALLSPV